MAKKKELEKLILKYRAKIAALEEKEEDVARRIEILENLLPTVLVWYMWKVSQVRREVPFPQHENDEEARAKIEHLEGVLEQLQLADRLLRDEEIIMRQRIKELEASLDEIPDEDDIIIPTKRPHSMRDFKEYNFEDLLQNKDTDWKTVCENLLKQVSELNDELKNSSQKLRESEDYVKHLEEKYSKLEKELQEKISLLEQRAAHPKVGSEDEDDKRLQKENENKEALSAMKGALADVKSAKELLSQSRSTIFSKDIKKIPSSTVQDKQSAELFKDKLTPQPGIQTEEEPEPGKDSVDIFSQKAEETALDTTHREKDIQELGDDEKPVSVDTPVTTETADKDQIQRKSIEPTVTEIQEDSIAQPGAAGVAEFGSPGRSQTGEAPGKGVLQEQDLEAPAVTSVPEEAGAPGVGDAVAEGVPQAQVEGAPTVSAFPEEAGAPGTEKADAEGVPQAQVKEAPAVSVVSEGAGAPETEEAVIPKAEPHDGSQTEEAPDKGVPQALGEEAPAVSVVKEETGAPGAEDVAEGVPRAQVEEAPAMSVVSEGASAPETQEVVVPKTEPRDGSQTEEAPDIGVPPAQGEEIPAVSVVKEEAGAPGTEEDVADGVPQAQGEETPAVSAVQEESGAPEAGEDVAEGVPQAQGEETPAFSVIKEEKGAPGTEEDVAGGVPEEQVEEAPAVSVVSEGAGAPETEEAVIPKTEPRDGSQTEEAPDIGVPQAQGEDAPAVSIVQEEAGAPEAGEDVAEGVPQAQGEESPSFSVIKEESGAPGTEEDVAGGVPEEQVEEAPAVSVVSEGAGAPETGEAVVPKTEPRDGSQTEEAPDKGVPQALGEEAPAVSVVKEETSAPGVEDVAEGVPRAQVEEAPAMSVVSEGASAPETQEAVVPKTEPRNGSQTEEAPDIGVPQAQGEDAPAVSIVQEEAGAPEAGEDVAEGVSQAQGEESPSFSVIKEESGAPGTEEDVAGGVPEEQVEEAPAVSVVSEGAGAPETGEAVVPKTEPRDGSQTEEAPDIGVPPAQGAEIPAVSVVQEEAGAPGTEDDVAEGVPQAQGEETPAVSAVQEESGAPRSDEDVAEGVPQAQGEEAPAVYAVPKEAGAPGAEEDVEGVPQAQVEEAPAVSIVSEGGGAPETEEAVVVKTEPRGGSHTEEAPDIGVPQAQGEETPAVSVVQEEAGAPGTEEAVAEGIPQAQVEEAPAVSAVPEEAAAPGIPGITKPKEVTVSELGHLDDSIDKPETKSSRKLSVLESKPILPVEFKDLSRDAEGLLGTKPLEGVSKDKSSKDITPAGVGVKQEPGTPSGPTGSSLAVKTLQDKMRVKDHLIKTMADQLRDLARNNVWEGGKTLEAAANDGPYKTYDFDRNLLTLYLKGEEPQNYTPTMTAGSNPLNVRILRKLDKESLFVEWDPQPSPEVAGFQIFLNGYFKYWVHSAKRNLALLHPVDLKSKIEIAVSPIDGKGRIISRSIIIYEP